MDNELIAVLRDVEFLDGIPDEYLQELATVAQQQDYAAGKLIFREGDAAEAIYLIVSGQVALEICASGLGCRRILTVGGGELLGWSPVLEQRQLTATARALMPTRVIALSGAQILTLCEHEPRFGYQFMRRAALALAKRLNATRMQLLDVFGSQMPEVDDVRIES